MEKELRVNITEILKEKTENADRITDVGMISSESKSSAMVKGNGDIVIAASKNAQYKIKKADNSASEISFQSNTITNRKNIIADDIVVNNHKMNPIFYNYTNYVQMENETTGIGNLTVQGHVLVKTFEPALKKWVLIRRPMRAPMFSNSLNVASAISASNVDDKITREDVS